MYQIKRLRYEYWPWYLFFIPVLPICLYWMIRTGKLLYFTAANPGIYMGGFFGESKSDILEQIPQAYKPLTLPILPGQPIDLSGWRFPVILKPDIGERGQGVQLIMDKDQLEKVLQDLNAPHILQEYIEYPLELGVFYYRYPEGLGSGITSLTLKGMMTVTGDGVSNIAQLMKQKTRSRLQIKRLMSEKPGLMTTIPNIGTEVLLEHRGNHCLGTEFINANHHINSELVALFDKISRDFDGFYYGRYDVKAKSLESLYRGEVSIFELNGVSSEPGHIYDINYNLLRAYRDVVKNWMIMGKISQMNINKGVKTAPLKEFFKTVTQHFKS